MAKPLTHIALSAAFVGSVAAEVVDSDTLIILERGADCRTSCTAHDGDGPPFTLSFDSYREDYYTYINLRIEDREFKGLPVSRGFTEDGSLPFDKYTFPQHTLYGFVSLISTKNMEVHYFIRLDDGFRYLGKFAKLGYDTDSGMFVEFFVHGQANISRFNYILQGDRLVEVES